jgi:hypothetical protein
MGESSDCTWSAQGYVFTGTAEATFSPDGRTATGLVTVSGSGAGQSCDATYEVIFTRQ